MLAYVKLSRPLNLFIIGLTMYGLGWYFNSVSEQSVPGIDSLPFFLLVFSTILIAAGGNIINDYFDIRADRVNKPERQILGKDITRRKAIALHWTLNFFAFSIAIYLSFHFKSFWYVFIHVVSMNILWFYSANLKRRFLIGNVLIAGLTGLVPILVGLYFSTINTDDRILQIFPLQAYSIGNFITFVALFTAIFAFILNLSREILKDIEDIKGDLKLNADTIPIRLGYTKSKFIVLFILGINLIYSITLLTLFNQIESLNLIFIYLSMLFVLIGMIITILAKTRKMFKQASFMIKLAMIAGVVTPIFWQILITFK